VLPITERKVVRKDSSIFIGEANLLLVRDSKGQPRYALGILRDITDRKEIEEQLRQSEQKCRNLVEQISDVIYSMDAHGIITCISLLSLKPASAMGWW
jgi:PAS domain-containing protein